jgi:hypothetical protein
MSEPDQLAQGLRTGARRLIPRWEFGHLRALGYARIGGATVLTTCSLLTPVFGGRDTKTFAWATAFLCLAALNLATGIWELRIAGSSSS